VRSALQADPTMVANLLSSLAYSLEETEAQLASLAQLSSTARIVKVLLEHSPSTSLEARVAALTREEIGNLSGTSMETVSRLIHSLTRQGFLRLRGRTIFIVQRASLEQLIADSVGES
jgi:CRP/FNR family transcriptional regulator, cyclic AMP receptor protein